ncbi:MAG: DNA cytosine methyltransferase [Rhodanobacter sp.]
MQIPVVDIFAGPGGLGEGFSAFTPRRGTDHPPFKIAISAEMEANAARTLRLRAFFRQFPAGQAPGSYYEYVAGRRSTPYTDESEKQWIAAEEEARQLTLGNSSDDAELRERIKRIAKKGKEWVLIGGPPCQAYSLVGRARNRGIKGYAPENDHRYFLYQQYLKIINEFRPTAFVMENVKGLLSARLDGNLVFPEIMESLERPGGRNGPRYRIIPLAVPKAGAEATNPDPHSYILRAETLGVPQARHRVILLGLAEDLNGRQGKLLVPDELRFSVSDVIGGLPPLRSGTTDMRADNWPNIAAELLGSAAKAAIAYPEVVGILESAKAALKQGDPGQGGRWMKRTAKSDTVPAHLESWLIDRRLNGILNHEVRDHMREDLMRYAYASAFASAYGHSPRGAGEFPVPLHPNHRNWKSGKFVDRFKVQLKGHPSSTVTSHLAKDGHYFIHPDPKQLRSLSVREAARLQTFPDNYFFEGSRGAQFRQVGNAVPPWMARQIAGAVYTFLDN